jgi:tetratricopeptide (TPR) repeat protein
MSFTSCSCSLAGTRYCEICESNPDKGAIKITSSRFSEFASNIVVDGVKYHIQTENLGPKKPIIITSAVKDGEMISTKKTDYSYLLGNTGLDKKLEELMHQEHLSVVNMLKAETPKERKMVSEYLNDVKSLLRANNLESALKALDKALTEHPFNALLLSYYGCLDAVVNKNFNHGVDLCKTAIEISKEEVEFDHEGFYPVFYLNLGRAYLAAGAKKDAAAVFKKGLDADPEDPDLLREIKRLGMRKKPVVPFLKRSNPINKYVGKLVQNK